MEFALRSTIAHVMLSIMDWTVLITSVMTTWPLIYLESVLVMECVSLMTIVPVRIDTMVMTALSTNVMGSGQRMPLFAVVMECAVESIGVLVIQITYSLLIVVGLGVLGSLTMTVRYVMEEAVVQGSTPVPVYRDMQGLIASCMLVRESNSPVLMCAVGTESVWVPITVPVILDTKAQIAQCIHALVYSQLNLQFAVLKGFA